jgi:hypothetical protein
MAYANSVVLNVHMALANPIVLNVHQVPHSHEHFLFELLLCWKETSSLAKSSCVALESHVLGQRHYMASFLFAELHNTSLQCCHRHPQLIESVI